MKKPKVSHLVFMRSIRISLYCSGRHERGALRIKHDIRTKIEFFTADTDAKDQIPDYI